MKSDVINRICKGGELNDEITVRGRFTESDAAILMRQVLSCVNYLHQKNIAHRDLKPENILLENNKDLSQIKVADFGTAIQWDSNNKQPFTDKVGTLIYMAPEVFKLEYSEKCDIWSCGVMLYRLIANRYPFEASDEVTLRQKLMKGEFDLTSSSWSGISNELKDLLRGMLQTDPKLRLSADQAVNHPFFTKKEAYKLTKDDIVKGALENMLGFNAKTNAKISIYSYFSSELLSKAELNIITNVFKELDKDGDGILKYRELVQCITKYLPEKSGEFEINGKDLLTMINLGSRERE